MRARRFTSAGAPAVPAFQLNETTLGRQQAASIASIRHGGFAVAWDKPAFNGREALLAQREQPRTKRLIQFRLEDPDTLVVHDAPIYRDGVLVGRTSSGMWSYTEDRCLAMGYLTNTDGEGVVKGWLDSGDFEVQVGLDRIPLSTSIRSWYDPKNERVRM